jgi:polyisoprenoid-binding protein YceI
MMTGHAGDISAVPRAPRGAGIAPLGMALLLWAAALGTGAGLGLFSRAPTVAAIAAEPAELAVPQGNWLVEGGTLGITIRQLGQEVHGTFANWAAEITFDPDPNSLNPGHVRVTIDIASLTLGQVTPQALGGDFFDAATHPEAVFKADLVPTVDRTYLAEGFLTLKAARVPVTFEFRLDLEGNTARIVGRATLDRRDFAIGMQMADEATLGFAVNVAVELTAVTVD